MGARRLLNVAAYVATAVVAWFVLTTLLLWRNQERVVFQPPSTITPDPLAAKRVEISAADGKPTFVYVVSPKVAPPKPTVVLAFHGNADLAAWQVPWAQELVHRTGAVVVVVEFRGYGGVAGTPSYASAADDARGALAFVKTLAPSRVILFGHSLGSAIATELASEMTKEPPTALILQSPFTSARAMAARMFVPVFLGVFELISRVPYDTRQRVKTLDVPVWVAHGSMDITIPSRMGREVSEASLRKGELLLVPRAGHNDVYEVGGESYWRWISEAVTGTPSAPVAELEQKRGGRPE